VKAACPFTTADGTILTMRRLRPSSPQPQCIVSDGKDWTKNVPEVEFPYIQSVYKVCGAQTVENRHFAEEGHDYGPSKREAMYRFMAKHLRLDLKAVAAADGKIDESETTVDPQALAVFTPNIRVRPARSRTGGSCPRLAAGQGQSGGATHRHDARQIQAKFFSHSPSRSPARRFSTRSPTRSALSRTQV